MFNRLVLSEFVVPGVPTPKGRPRATARGHMYTPSETREAEELVRWYWRAGHSLTGYPKTLVQPEYELEVNIYFPNRRHGDVDNVVKLISDALNKHAYRDDKEIAKLTAERFYDATNPRTEVRVIYREEIP